MFRSTTIIRELVLNLTEVIFVLKHSVCCVLAHQQITYNDVILPSVLTYI